MSQITSCIPGRATVLSAKLFPFYVHQQRLGPSISLVQEVHSDGQSAKHVQHQQDVNQQGCFFGSQLPMMQSCSYN